MLKCNAQSSPIRYNLKCSSPSNRIAVPRGIANSKELN